MQVGLITFAGTRRLRAGLAAATGSRSSSSSRSASSASPRSASRCRTRSRTSTPPRPTSTRCSCRSSSSRASSTTPTTRPEFLRAIAEALPLKHLIDGLSGAMVTGAGASRDHLGACSCSRSGPRPGSCSPCAASPGTRATDARARRRRRAPRSRRRGSAGSARRRRGRSPPGRSGPSTIARCGGLSSQARSVARAEPRPPQPQAIASAARAPLQPAARSRLGERRAGPLVGEVAAAHHVAGVAAGGAVEAAVGAHRPEAAARALGVEDAVQRGAHARERSRRATGAGRRRRRRRAAVIERGGAPRRRERRRAARRPRRASRARMARTGRPARGERRRMRARPPGPDGCSGPPCSRSSDGRAADRAPPMTPSSARFLTLTAAGLRCAGYPDPAAAPRHRTSASRRTPSASRSGGSAANVRRRYGRRRLRREPRAAGEDLHARAVARARPGRRRPRRGSSRTQTCRPPPGGVARPGPSAASTAATSASRRSRRAQPEAPEVARPGRRAEQLDRRLLERAGDEEVLDHPRGAEPGERRAAGGDRADPQPRRGDLGERA